jgi:hypothetical protein
LLDGLFEQPARLTSKLSAFSEKTALPNCLVISSTESRRLIAERYP